MNTNINPVIYPILLIVFLSISWGYSALKVIEGKVNKRNPLLNLFFTIIFAMILYLCGFFNSIHWPQITWIILSSIGLTIAFMDKVESKPSGHISFIIAILIVLFIYVKGGAFQYLSTQ